MKKYNVCIVGGGSTYTLGFLKSFARMQEEFPLNKLVLFDIDGERQKPIGQYGDIMFAERYPELDFSYTTDPKEAYQDMDFIFMQMRAGGLHMRQKDEHIPLSFGKVGQETCGAGGMAYGLRSCVDMIEAVHQIREYSLRHGYLTTLTRLQSLQRHSEESSLMIRESSISVTSLRM